MADLSTLLRVEAWNYGQGNKNHGHMKNALTLT